MYAHNDRPIAPAVSPEPTHPPPGTRIDNGALELVEVLGVGGYGVVYRAVEVHSPTPRSFAVKCLLHATHVSPRTRQLHIREIALHQLCGAHPNVVTLHRVIDDGSGHTYIVMDFAPDGDLFSQILYGCRYLGNTRLIKHVFGQLLSAVEYSHSLGIYHRDLKPENILCFEGGYRVALTDFGLATTEKISEEFRTGSVYHMSPECQGGEFAPTGSYSPMFNDVWSLGIVLLNLATGRNPWKSATPTDSTFRAYLHDPAHFLLSVLPISHELNAVLVRMLALDWRQRATIPEVRAALAGVKNFYAEGAVFEGSMARCPWEVAADIEAADSPTKDTEEQRQPIQSAWSTDSSLLYNPAGSDTSSNTQYSSCGATWAFDSPTSSMCESPHPKMFEFDFDDAFERPRTPPTIHLSAEDVSPPRAEFVVTPSVVDFTPQRPATGPRKGLTINTSVLDPEYYGVPCAKTASLDSISTGSSAMQTAVDEEAYASSFFLAGSKLSLYPNDDDSDLDADEDKDVSMTSPLAMTWASDGAEEDVSIALSRFCSTQSSLYRSATPSPATDKVSAWHAAQCQSPPQSPLDSVTDASPVRRPPTRSAPQKPHTAGALKIHIPSAPPAAKVEQSRTVDAELELESFPFQSFIFQQTPTSPSFETWPAIAANTATPTPPSKVPVNLMRPAWFVRTKLFGGGAGR